jgi:hypothetical protein
MIKDISKPFKKEVKMLGTVLSVIFVIAILIAVEIIRSKVRKMAGLK